MKYIFKLLILIIFVSFQSSEFILEKTINATGNFITTDKFENIYLIDRNKLTKFDNSGKQEKTYCNMNAGNISFVDAENPLKILVFHQDFGQIDFLDNTLSLNGSSISLENLRLEQSSLVCSSYDNGLWVYNPNSFQLIRIDKYLKINLESGNLTQTLGYNINPNFLIEKNNKVYLNAPEHGILVFDRYGAYLKTIPFFNLTSFQLKEDLLIYSKNSQIISYNLKTLEETITDLPLKNFSSLRIEQKLFLLTEKGIKIYSVK